MEKTEAFLKSFKELEQDLATISGIKDKFISFSRSLNKIFQERLNPVVSLSNNYEFLRSANDLRNLLTHNHDICEPNDDFIARFQILVKEIKNPIKCYDIATKNENILACAPEDNLIEVISRMNSRGISHVPVLNNGVVTGVFSRSSLYEYYSHNKEIVLNKQTKISDVIYATSFLSHSNESYRFIAKNTNVYSIFDSIIKKIKGHPRVVCLFITEHGDPKEKLLGIVTETDLFKVSLLANLEY